MVYTNGFKARMVERMADHQTSATQLAEEVGVPQSTLSRWLREAGSMGDMKSNHKKRQSRRPQDWTPEEKVQAVIEAAGLSEDELGAFLRSRGLHSDHLAQWRQEAIAGLRAPSRKEKKQANREAHKIKRLEQELRRKEKALAEAAALLVLKKKLDSYFGDEGNDT